MKITQIKIYKMNNDKMKGKAQITLDNCLVIKDIKIMESQKGLWISMPNKKTNSGEYVDTVFPITKEFREILNTSILNEYNKTSETSDEYITIDDDIELPF